MVAVVSAAAPRAVLESDLVRYSQRLHANGWVANHDGNLSVRLERGLFLCTPTAVSKGDVRREWLVAVDERGQVVSGQRRVFSELDLHLYIFRSRPDVCAVIHSHAPHATALAVAGVAVSSRLLAEPVVTLGPEIPLVPYAPPKSAASTLNLGPYIGRVDAVTLENHGVMSWGPDLETAYLRMELVEHLAHIQILAAQVGTVRAIPDGDIEGLVAARKKAGLLGVADAVKKIPSVQ